MTTLQEENAGLWGRVVVAVGALAVAALVFRGLHGLVTARRAPQRREPSDVFEFNQTVSERALNLHDRYGGDWHENKAQALDQVAEKFPLGRVFRTRVLLRARELAHGKAPKPIHIHDALEVLVREEHTGPSRTRDWPRGRP